jgi:hypothetical protein
MQPVAARRVSLVWEQAWASWALPLVASSIAAALVAGAGARGVDAQRGVAFVVGPALLLVTLHARSGGYLHDDGVAATLPLPIAARRRFAAAHRVHMIGLGWQALWGAAAMAIAAADLRTAIGLVATFAALIACAALVEPLASGASAWLGRRVPPDGFAAQVQRTLGGGWTLPEAVVHLWAPALGLGLAAALAMPLQLAIDRWFDGLPVARGHLGACAGALGCAVAARLLAPRLYAGGVFEAVPWLRQAIRTLAGPPVPPPAPRWLAMLRDPALRLLVLQHQRLTPVPMLRLAILFVAAGIVASADAAPGPAAVGSVVGAAALWLLPAAAVRRHRLAMQRALAAMPIRDPRRAAWACLLVPVLLATAPVAARMVLA